ncbi:MAG: CBS domain-containing protein [Bryobacteraceae bacterium]|nr:CBS domain-containing protein [Bryobacteraceae bacterium]MDW8376572.1 CBS domain-containing protein [Bryobacterales bacterium]
MADTLLYLTELQGLKVFDLKHRPLGRVVEAALVPMVDPSRVDRFMIGGDRAWFTFRYDQVRSISLRGIELSDELLTPYHADEYMLRLVRDLLDQQIIDAHGRKVVRVTDVTFEIRQAEGYQALFVTEVDVGLRSVFRRLFQGVLPRSWIRKLQEPIPVNSISWQFCNIIEPDPMRRLRLNITPDQLEKMHPADLADIVEELGPDAREAVITALDSETAAETLSEVDIGIQARILESLEAEKAAEIIEEMAPDQAADVLQELEEETSEEILEEMESEPKLEVQELLEYDEDTAGGMMTTDFVALPEEVRVADAVRHIRQAQETVELLHAVVVVDRADRFVGVVPFSRMFTAAPDQTLGELADRQAQCVLDTAPESQVTEIFDKYSLLCLPVVDEQSRVVGMITADDVISVLRRGK